MKKLLALAFLTALVLASPSFTDVAGEGPEQVNRPQQENGKF